MSARVLQWYAVAPHAAFRVGGASAGRPCRENSRSGGDAHQSREPRRGKAWRRCVLLLKNRHFAVEPWRAAALVFALIVGAYVAASGMASPVYARLSWLGVLPLLIAVRSAPPILAGLCGTIWGLCYWLFAGAVLPTTVPLTATACLQLTGGASAFALLGALITRRYGFHPFLLSATWLLLDVVVCVGGHSVDMSTTVGDETSYSHFLARALGTACLGAALVLINAILLLAVCKLAHCDDAPRKWAWVTLVKVGGIRALSSSPAYHPVVYGPPRAPPIIL